MSYLSETSLLEHKIVVLIEDVCSTQFVSWTHSHFAGSVKSET
jgi:hypothetical protein